MTQYGKVLADIPILGAETFHSKGSGTVQAPCGYRSSKATVEVQQKLTQRKWCVAQTFPQSQGSPAAGTDTPAQKPNDTRGRLGLPVWEGSESWRKTPVL